MRLRRIVLALALIVCVLARVHALADAGSAVLDLDRVTPEVTTFTNGNKTVRFVAMQHVALPEFYSAVKNIVARSKANDFVLFYEFINFYLLDDIGQRKIRKAIGFLPMPDIYEEIFRLGSDEPYVAQRNEIFLGLGDGPDVNVDISPQDFLNAIEQRFGPVNLGKKDFDTSIGEFAPEPLSLPGLDDIVLKRRNEILAGAVAQADYRKIIVLYGAGHREGFLSELRKLDTTWKK